MKKYFLYPFLLFLLGLDTLPKPYTIGAALTLSGKLASGGKLVQNGIILAQEELNQKGILNLKVIYEDTQSEAKNAVSSIKKLIEVDKVKIILGPIRSNDVLAVAPFTEAKKIILFTPVSASDEITKAGDFVFRNRESAYLHAKSMVEYFSKCEIYKVASFTAYSANSISYSKGFKKFFEDKGGIVTDAIEYEESTQDVRSELLRVLQDKADAIYLSCATGVDCGVVVKQARELGFKGIIAATMLVERDEFKVTAGETGEGVMFTSTSFSVSDPDVQDFSKAYRKRFGEEPEIFGANAYDAVKLLADGIIKCGELNTTCLRDYLYSVKNYPGMGGLTSFDENGDVIKPVIVKVIKNGKYEEKHGCI